LIPHPILSETPEKKKPELGNLENFEGLSSGELNVPPLEVRVVDLTGTPMKLSPKTNKWEPITTGSVLPPNTRIATLKNETVRLEIPGVSFIEVDTGSEIVVSKLVRNTTTSIDRSGLLVNVKKKVINDVDLEALHGKIENSLREHETMQNDYQIKTPHAVAGVRGTSFSCETSESTTECSVLEGSIRFASLDVPSVNQLLGAGLSVNYQSGETEADTVQSITEQNKRDLETTREEAQDELLFEPSLSNFTVNDNSFESLQNDRYRTTIDYYRPRQLDFQGQARAREENTELARVISRVNGETVPVDGLDQWQFTTTPDTVSPGRERTIEATVTAVDDTGTRSYPKRLLVNLRHPDPKDVLPDDYNNGSVSVSLKQAGKRSLEAIDYPYHLYRNDRRSSEDKSLILSGEASSTAPITGVAYSLNRGISWNQATGQENWSFDVSFPVQASRTIEPRLIAWTNNKIIGRPVRTGKLVYHDQSLKSHAREQFITFWEKFSVKDKKALRRLLTDDFEYTTESAQSGSEDDFNSFLSSFFNQVRNLQIFHQLSDVTVHEDQTTLTFDVEIQGIHRPSNSGFKLIGTDVTMTLERTSDGRYALVSMDGLRHRLYLFTLSPKTVAGGSGIRFDNFSINQEPVGDILLGKQTVFGETRWVMETGSGFQQAGIFRLNTNQISEVFPIPERGSSLYQDAARIRTNQLYAVNILGTSQQSIIGLIRINSIRDDTLSVDLMSSIPIGQ
jgi:hypothetical protein